MIRQCRADITVCGILLMGGLCLTAPSLSVAQEGEEADSLQNVVAQLRERLNRADVGERTQALQGQLLQTMKAHAAQRTTNVKEDEAPTSRQTLPDTASASANPSDQSDKEDVINGNQQQTTTQPGEGQAGTSAGVGQGATESKQAFSARQEAALDAFWAQFPEELQSRMRTGMGPSFSNSYRKRLRRYYESLNESRE